MTVLTRESSTPIVQKLDCNIGILCLGGAWKTEVKQWGRLVIAISLSTSVSKLLIN